MREKILNTDVIKRQSEHIEDLKKKLGAQPPKGGEGKAELTRAVKIFTGQRSKKKRRHIPILDQWVEIEVSPEGKTVTTLYPSNEILIQGGRSYGPRRSWFIAGCILWMACRRSTRGRRGKSRFG